MFVKGLLVKKLFDENLEFAIDGDNVVARKHNTTILIPGNVYRAELDGEVYETSARKITNDDASLVFDNFEIRDYYASDNIEVTIYNSSNTAARSVKIYSVNHNAKKIDPDLLPDNIGGGGGASSWNDLKDKPFEEEAERRIVWTAATDVTDFITPHAQRNIYYKISDEVFGVDDLKGAYFFVNGNAATRIDLNEATEVQGGCSFSNKFCSIYDTEVNLGIAGDGVPDTFPSTGTYVAMVKAFDVEFVIPSRVTKKLDEKFLPDGDTFTVVITYDGVNGHTANKTFEEVVDAIEAGAYIDIKFRFVYDGGTITYKTVSDFMWRPNTADVPYIEFMAGSIYYDDNGWYWTADGISHIQPSGGK